MRDRRHRLVPDDFDVPEILEHSLFRLRMLTVNDLVKDYDAAMSSVEHLRATYSPESGGSWPEGLTIEDDLVDLGWHQREFTRRSSFAYTVMTPGEGRCLGCVYIKPTRKRGHDCKVDDVGARRCPRERPRRGALPDRSCVDCRRLALHQSRLPRPRHHLRGMARDADRLSRPGRSGDCFVRVARPASAPEEERGCRMTRSMSRPSVVRRRRRRSSEYSRKSPRRSRDTSGWDRPRRRAHSICVMRHWRTMTSMRLTSSVFTRWARRHRAGRDRRRRCRSPVPRPCRWVPRRQFPRCVPR